MYMSTVDPGYMLKLHFPTNNALLINFRLSSNADIIVTKHRLGMLIGAQTCEKCAFNIVRIPTELPFCMPPLVVGYVQLRLPFL